MPAAATATPSIAIGLGLSIILIFPRFDGIEEPLMEVGSGRFKRADSKLRIQMSTVLSRTL